MTYGKPAQKPLWRLSGKERRVILIVGDLLVSIIALVAALYFWSQKDAWLQFSWEFMRTRPAAWFYLLPFMWMVLLVELYDPRRSSHISDTLRGIGIAFLIGAIFYLLIYFTSEPNSLPRRGVSAFLLVVAVLTLLWRLLYIRIFTAPHFMRRVLIAGAGRAGTELVQVIKGIWPPPFYLVGLIDDDPEKQNKEVDGFPIMGTSEELLEIIEKEHISDLIFAISGPMNPPMFNALVAAEEKGVDVTTMARVYEELLGRVPIFLLESDWLLRSFVDQSHTSGFYDLGKRLVDILGGLVGGFVFVIFFPFIAVAILLDSGRPIFYSQERLGKNGRPYYIIKFRTMRQDAEKDGIARPASVNDKRVTRIGNFLRKSHLDELPQIINIIKGEMSLVGPRSERPELITKLEKQIPFYRARLFVKPGLTGWAQVNYGYANDAAQNAIKQEYDLYYIKHQNLLLDFYIMFRTVGTVIGLRGQ